MKKPASKDRKKGVTDLPAKPVSSDQAESVKGGRSLKSLPRRKRQRGRGAARGRRGEGPEI